MKTKFLFLLSLPLLISACSTPTNNSSEIKSSDSPETISSEESVISQENTLPSSDLSSDPSSEEAKSSSSARSEEKNSSSESQGNQPAEDNFSVAFKSILIKDEEGNPVDINYDIPKSYFSFDHDATIFSKPLALSALSFVVCAPNKADIVNAYTEYGFDTIITSNEYGLDETKDTVLYTIGHKTIEDGDLVNITISGYQYAKPWEMNLTIGESGDHYGFAQAASKVLPLFETYLKKYDTNKTKLFINGYSRSAAIGQMVCASLIEKKVILEDNLYGYFFETPRGIDSAKEKEYNSIFNIINSGDLVTFISPEEYGTKRIGVDIDLRNDDMDHALADYDEKLVLPEFTDSESLSLGEEYVFHNEEEFCKFVFNMLLQPITDKPEEQPLKDLSTRENYCKNIQSNAAYLASLFLSMPSDILSDITTKLSTMLSDSPFAALGLIDTDGLYNFIKPVFDEHNYAYDDDALRENLNGAGYLLQQKIGIVLLIAGDQFRNNLMRSVYLHTLEVVIPLLFYLDLDPAK